MGANITEGQPNGKLALNWPTVILILLTGGGNFLATNRAEQTSTTEMERARNEVHQIHQSVDDFEKGMKASFENQNRILANQTRMLETQQSILSELHGGARHP
jgi:hypothetical protein